MAESPYRVEVFSSKAEISQLLAAIDCDTFGDLTKETRIRLGEALKSKVARVTALFNGKLCGVSLITLNRRKSEAFGRWRAIAPESQGQGLINLLHTRELQLCQDEGIAMVRSQGETLYGQRSLEKLGFQPATDRDPRDMILDVNTALTKIANQNIS